MNARLTALFSLALVPATSSAADAPGDGVAFFESKIRPVLVKHCYECHSAEAGKSKGGLLLDTREGIRAGGDRGPAVVPGESGEEPAADRDRAHRSRPRDAAEEGPAAEGGDRRHRSVDQDGRAGSARSDRQDRGQRPPVDLESGRKFWAYRKPVAAAGAGDEATPTWAKRDLDRFILAKLEANGLDAVAGCRRR